MATSSIFANFTITDEKTAEQFLDALDKAADRKTAGLILYALVNHVQSKVKTDDDSISFSKEIQRICSLNKKTADYLSAVFLNLYSKENENDWQKKNLEGLAQFMAEEFECTWKGMAVWDAGF